MKLGELYLVSPHRIYSGLLRTNLLDEIVRDMDAFPTRAAIYLQGSLAPSAIFSISQIGGSLIVAGGVLGGADDNFPVGSLVSLQANVNDATGSFAAPTFSAFAISGQSSPIEVGATIAAGSKTFTWATTNSSNVQANSIKITDTTTSTVLASGLANTGSHAITIGAITNILPASHVWTIGALDTQGNGFSKTYTVLWEWRVYAGDSSNATLTANQIKALSASSALQASFAGTYPIVQSSDYGYFSYPDAMGDVSNFIDASTGFPISMATAADDPAYSNTANGWSYDLVSVTNAQSIATNYRVYRTQYTFSGTLQMRVS